MKILFCIPTLDHGGAERQLSYLAGELTKMGHDVHVAAVRGGPHLDKLVSSGVIWHGLGRRHNKNHSVFFRPLKFIRIPVIWLRLIRLIRELRPDVVQTILAPMDLLAGPAARWYGSKWILRESSCADLYRRDLRFWIRFLVGRKSDAIVSNSAGGCKYWEPVFGGKVLRLIPNGVPFEEIAQSNSGCTTNFAFASNEKIVLCAGRIDHGKNVESLIAALAAISDEVAFTAIVCGDGKRRRAAERLARRLGIGHRVIFAGYVDDLWYLMRQADAIASLSLFEGCPNVVLEAMASGCPLVLSDIKAHKEILDDRSAAFVDLRQLNAAAEVIKATLLDSAGARNRAAAAQARVSDFSIQQSAHLHERLYLDVLSHANLQVAQSLSADGNRNNLELSAN